MKRLALAVLLAVCGVNADDYEEFLEYKKWQEQKAKSQGKNTAKDSAKANAIDSTQEDYKNLLKSRKDSNGDLSQGNSIKTSDSAKNMANKTQDSTKSLDSKSISQLKSGGFIGFDIGNNKGFRIEPYCSGGLFSGNVSLNGGYQWYFSDMMGVGISTALGYNGSAWCSEFAINSIAWGVESQYLLDFTQKVGMSIGAGFEASHLIYTDKATLIHHFIPAFSASIRLLFRSSNLKHIFGIGYRYRTYRQQTIKADSKQLRFSQGEYGMIVAFSYSYKF